MLWHPKTLQNLAMYNVFFIFGRFSIAGKLPKWPKIPFQYPLALRHPKILEKCRKHHRILVSVRNRFWAPPAKADIATAILTNVIEHLVLLFCPPISTPSPPKRCGRIYLHLFIYLFMCVNVFMLCIYMLSYIYMLYIYTYRNEHIIWEVPCFSTSSTEASTGAVRPAAPCEPRGHLAMGNQRLDSDWIEVQGKYPLVNIQKTMENHHF